MIVEPYNGDLGHLFENLLIKRVKKHLNSGNKNKLVPPKVKISEISSLGFIAVDFTRPMVVHPEMKELNSDGLL